MKGFDTNVFVRYLTRDDSSQFALAREIIENAKSRGERLFVNMVVLCELTWRLMSTAAGRRILLIT